MTHKEAIGQLKCNVEGDYINLDDLEAFNIAIPALEKQILKKPTPHKVDVDKIKIGNANWCKGTTVYKCPCCNELISRIYDYCYKCGQALDWSDTE